MSAFRPVIGSPYHRDRTPIVLHGYEVHQNGALGPLARAVCETALPLLNGTGRAAYLVGGWHLPEPGPQLTIAHAMRAWLMEHGIHGEDIVICHAHPHLASCMPPRDTAEEVLAIRIILNGMYKPLPLWEIGFEYVAWSAHIPRCQALYEWYGMLKARPVAAIPDRVPMVRRIAEYAGRAWSAVDPGAIGILPRCVRKHRTLAHEGAPLIR